ncbi:hypothetical protein TRIATDRAFT_256570 [Trichoderma atroviride IMI 206040]|uniref:Uncharacterized protein n=1 Tax=Hypocrea atroviridis (strain ATCC 20476 / IMI 206040) TaxID=452589 RepID=G9NRU2_HYPAI|nr:uncharacterized protein TRIATDRAFT_256570 [Trichoderma atroviride IMI 206040]EHK46724.1 hypothetical protein TRIATDRAFT_256570 [Trichoderma atroviride IMI 206040]
MFSPSQGEKMKKAEFGAESRSLRLDTNILSQHTRAEIPKLSARSSGLATSGGVGP